MNFKEFLKPEWKKFVLPLIFVLLYILLQSTFYTYGAVIDKYGCEEASILKEYAQSIEQNNTVLIEKMSRELQQFYENENMKENGLRKQDIRMKLSELNPISSFFKKTDIFFRDSCDYNIASDICNFYSNKKTYDCFEIGSQQKSLTDWDGVGSVNDYLEERIEYRKATYMDAIFNSFFILFVWYLISSIILFLFRIFKKTKKQELNNELIQ